MNCALIELITDRKVLGEFHVGAREGRTTAKLVVY